MPHYRNSGYEDFAAEAQGARIRRLLKIIGKRTSKANKDSTFTCTSIALLIGKDRSVTSRKLDDQVGWTREEIQIVSEKSGIPFDTLYVIDNKARRRSVNVKPMKLRDVVGDTKLLNHFLGVQLDSRTRDMVLKYLAKLENYIIEKKEAIRHRRGKEIERRRSVEMLKFIFKTLHDETGVWEHELIRMKKIHGSYLHFQERFDELKASYRK